MREKEIVAIYNYYFNNLQMYEETVRNLQTNLRYRQIGVVDGIELALAMERLDIFKHTMDNVLTLLQIEWYNSENNPLNKNRQSFTKYKLYCNFTSSFLIIFFPYYILFFKF